MVGMPAVFRPRFRRGAAKAEPEGDLTEKTPFEAAGDDVEGEEVAGDLTNVDDDVVDDAGEDAGEWLAYEFHGWSLESRVMLQQLLTVDQVVHSWQGTTLMVHESLEATVDSLVDEVEETEKAKEAIARPIGPDDPLTAFELAEWPEALRAELMERLVQARVPHILDTEGDTDPDGTAGDPDPDGTAGDPDPDGTAGDPDPDGTAGDPDAEGDADAGDPDAEGDADAADPDAEGDADAADPDAEGDADAADPDAEGDADAADPDAEGDADAERAEVCDLLVREADEERVELVIDDLLAREEEADFEEMDGLEVNGLLSDLFVACDRLRRDPRDYDGIRGVVVNARRVAAVRTPFGFSASNWRSLRNAAGDLLAMVEGEDSDEDDLRELAHNMSDALRMLI